MALHLKSTGIDFTDYGSTGTTGAAATGELLDDFEEGTWTPTCASKAFNNVTYAKYLKVSSMVYTTNHSRWDTSGSGNTQINGGGLPFATETGEYCSYTLDTNATDIGALHNTHIRHNSNSTTWAGYYGSDVALVQGNYNVNNGHFMWEGHFWTAGN